MTRTEYGIRYLDDEGTWRRSLSEPDPIATSARAVTVLDHARGVFPGAVWRVVTRTVPDWEPADEAALRGSPKADGCCPTCAGTGVDRSSGETNGKCWDCYGTGHCHPMDDRGCEDQP